jgi:hypothetical protein
VRCINRGMNGIGDHLDIERPGDHVDTMHMRLFTYWRAPL